MILFELNIDTRQIKTSIESLKRQRENCKNNLKNKN